MITKNGRAIATTLRTAGMDWDWQQSDNVLDTLSLICRHTATYTRLHEWLASGHPIYGGEWINKNWDRLEAKDLRLEKRLAELGEELKTYVSAGAPELETHSLYGVTITVTDEHGITRTRDMGK